MRKLLLLTLAVYSLHAAVLQGTVVENQTGHLLARALVTVQPVTGTPGRSLSARTNTYGAFEFGSLAPGSYLITASRRGFATVPYGQKHWSAAGKPVVVEDATPAVITIRLPRFGAIAGTVLDENDVGLPDHNVVAYRNTRPPQLVGRARTDDRGMYRIYGLEPGTYLIRTAGAQYEDESYLPTFAHQTALIDQAATAEVSLDQQLDNIDIRPLPGPLYTLTVSVLTYPQNLPVSVTLVSELGRQTFDGATHRFEALAPGRYEVFALAPLPGRAGGIQAAYETVAVAGDTSLNVITRQQQPTAFLFDGVPPQVANSNALHVLARRKDLAGDGPVETLKLAYKNAVLAPGRWEVMLAPVPEYFVSGFSASRSDRPPDGRADGWNEIRADAGYSSTVTFSLSAKPGSIYGVVSDNGNPVAGAPVFLEPLDLPPARRLADVFTARTGTDGQYRFAGLAPGNYRVLSSFEYNMPDTLAMSNAGARSVQVEEAREAQQNLDLYAGR